MRISQIAVAALLTLSMAHGLAAQDCDPNDPTLIKPDLKALTPRRVRIVQRDGARTLYFSTVVANLGQGPFEVVGKTVDTATGPVTLGTQVIQKTDGSTCNHVAGDFVYHPSHHHFHINDFAIYLLRKDDPFTGEIVAQSSKISFCLTDVEPQRGFSGVRQVFADCSVQEGVQGISSGWADVYDDFYPEQNIELDIGLPPGGVPAGTYYLVNTADPDNLFYEVNDDVQSNSTWVVVSVPGLLGGTDDQPTPTMAPPDVSPTPTATPKLRPTIVRQPRPTPAPRPPRAGGPVHPTRAPVVPPTRAPIIRPTRAPVVAPTHAPVTRATPAE